MIWEERSKYIAEFLEEHCLKVLTAKGVEYTRGEDDSNSNFKRVGKAIGIDPERIAWVYTLKHIDSISHYIKTGNAGTEPIEGRIGDAINYLLILASLIKEKENG